MTAFTIKMDIHTPCYTDTILQAIKSTVGAKPFLHYVHVITRVLRGEISSAASLPALGFILNHHPKAIILHNEAVAMTHDAMLMRDLPELYDDNSDSESSHHSGNSNDSYGEQLLDLMDHFANSEGARPADANTARFQAMRYLEVVLEGQRKGVGAVGNLAAEMATMGF